MGVPMNIYTYRAMLGILASALLLPCNQVYSSVGTASRRSTNSYGAQKSDTFAQKVGIYVHDACSSVGVKRHRETPSLLPVMRSMNKAMTAQDLLNELKHTVIVDGPMHLRDQATVPNEHEVAYQKICSSLLLSIAIPFTAQVRKSILQVLSALDRQIRYWEHQQGHKINYFFHKSPDKWVTGPAQEKEIKENLKLLCAVQKEHYRLLGLMTLHIEQFNEKAEYGMQYQWVCDYMSLVHELCVGSPLQVQGCGAYGKLLRNAKNLTRQVDRHEGMLKKQVLKSAQKPNYLARHWVDALGAVAGSCLSAYVARSSVHDQSWKTRDGLKKKYGAGKGAISAAIKNRVRDLEYAFFDPDAGSSAKVEELKEDYKNVISDMDKVTLERLNGKEVKIFDRLKEKLVARSKLAKEVKSAKDAGGKELNVKQQKKILEGNSQFLGQYLPKKKEEDGSAYFKRVVENAEKHPAQNVNEPSQAYFERVVKSSADNLKIDFLSGEIMPEVTKKMTENRHGIPFSTLDKKKEVSGKEKENDSESSSWWDSTKKVMTPGLFEKGQKLADRGQELLPVVESQLKDINDLKLVVSHIPNFTQLITRVGQEKLSKELVEKNRISLALTSAVPLVAVTSGIISSTSWFVYSLYKRITKMPSIEPVRSALIGIKQLLNEYQDVESSMMDPDDYGELVYLGHKLKSFKAAIKPEDQERFLRDLAKLASANYSTAQKMRHIELMGLRYKIFDSHTEKV